MTTLQQPMPETRVTLSLFCLIEGETATLRAFRQWVRQQVSEY